MDGNQAKHSIHPGFVWGFVPEAPTSPAELVDAISETIPRVPGGCWLRLRLRSGLGRRQRRCRRNETDRERERRGQDELGHKRYKVQPNKMKPMRPNNSHQRRPISAVRYKSFWIQRKRAPRPSYKRIISLSSSTLVAAHTHIPHHPAAAGEKPQVRSGGRRRSRARLPRCRSS